MGPASTVQKQYKCASVGYHAQHHRYATGSGVGQGEGGYIHVCVRTCALPPTFFVFRTNTRVTRMGHEKATLV